MGERPTAMLAIKPKPICDPLVLEPSSKGEGEAEAERHVRPLHFAMVDRSIYRCGFPNPANFRFLKTIELCSVLSVICFLSSFVFILFSSILLEYSEGGVQGFDWFVADCGFVIGPCLCPIREHGIPSGKRDYSLRDWDRWLQGNYFSHFWDLLDSNCSLWNMFYFSFVFFIIFGKLSLYFSLSFCIFGVNGCLLMLTPYPWQLIFSKHRIGMSFFFFFALLQIDVSEPLPISNLVFFIFQ